LYIYATLVPAVTLLLLGNRSKETAASANLQSSKHQSACATYFLVIASLTATGAVHAPLCTFYLLHCKSLDAAVPAAAGTQANVLVLKDGTSGGFQL
jgi:hypothetical protein